SVGSRTLEPARSARGVVPPAQEPTGGSGLPGERAACPAATLIPALVSALQVNPQAMQTNSAWLLREFFSIHPQSLHRRLVYGAGTSSTRSGALSSVRARNKPHPWARMLRFNPAFCR